MYLAIDIGGTKTRIATLDNQGVLKQTHKFPTPHDYVSFLREVAVTVDKFSTEKFTACCIAVPGKLDRDHGIAMELGNLPWRSIPIGKDVEKIVHCPTLIENDANLAGLSEAMLLKKTFRRVLYVTISTGIGTGFIVNQQIDEALRDSEGGHILLEHHGRLVTWESFASGKAIVRRFGKRAEDITDEATWHTISRDIALGLLDLAAVLQPQVVVLGGGVSTYFDRFNTFLDEYLERHATPLVPIPVVRAAQRPNEAVVYGCYDLARARYQ